MVFFNETTIVTLFYSTRIACIALKQELQAFKISSKEI